MDIEKIISQMTLEDKVAFCSGKSMWETKDFEKYGIPSMFMCDGPHGLRKQEAAGDMLGINDSRKATCFPAEVTTASSWDAPLLKRIGRAIGEEAIDQNVGMVLGPGANLKRNPLCGRNFEYFSEDPYLAGKLAAGFIRGVEGEGVGTSLKHFAGNSQETSRFVSDSVVDERTLRELYLSAFEIAVREGRPSMVMCAYPKLNGIHCSDHKELLTDILRDEWGFAGAVVTDWGALSDRIEAFHAGCDLCMPGGAAYMEKEAVQAVREGRLSEESVNASVRRILQLVEQAADETAAGTKPCDYEAHHRLSEEAALSGAVLLQNQNGLLPLKEDVKVAIIGYLAKDMRYQGSGSSHINPTKLVQPIDAFPACEYAAGCDEKGDTTPELLSEVENVAKNADVAVVFAGLPNRYESEGFDREHMRLPKGHEEMILAAAKANPKTVVVLLCGSAVECPWAEKVQSILYMGLPGQAGGSAVRKLLYGEANPSGRLAETWPLCYEDVPSSEIYGKTKDACYEEGIYVGYRYYEKAKKEVRWPFGYGLSYTKFAYSNLSLDGDWVTVAVENVGEFDGAEVVPLYVHAPQNGIHRPVRELKGFTKVFLEKGASCEVSFRLDERSFSVFDHGWKLPMGTYGISVGDLRVDVEKDGAEVLAPDWQKGSFYENCEGKPKQSVWELMLGRRYEPAPLHEKGQYTMEDSVEEMRKHSLIMKIMYKSVRNVFIKSMGKEAEDSPEFKMMMAASAGGPLRSMYISSGMPGGVFPGLLEMANGHFFRGIKKMIKG